MLVVPISSGFSKENALQSRALLRLREVYMTGISKKSIF
jgi:hypothetical protein